jgi:hypothetical protein
MDDDYSDKINIDDLYQRKREIDQLKLKVFRKILNRVHSKIKITSRQRSAEQFTFFVVPEFLVGTPRYDVAACIAYIIDKLKINGFNVTYTHPNLLFISWAHYYDKSKRMDIKKEYGVNVDGFGNIVKSKNTNDKKNTTPNDMNSLMFNNADVKVGAENSKKDYKQISTYKPTGNLIYNNALLKKIQDKTN